MVYDVEGKRPVIRMTVLVVVFAGTPRAYELTLRGVPVHFESRRLGQTTLGGVEKKNPSQEVWQNG